MIEIARSRRSSVGLDMAPLIDIIFLLLIFFMLSSSFLQPSMEVELPQAVDTSDQAIPEAIVISAGRDGALSLNGEEVMLEDVSRRVKALLAQMAEDAAVHVKGDKEMPYGLFVGVMDQVRQAGTSRIHIVHEGVLE